MYTDLKDQLTAELTAIEEAGTFKHERVITTPQGGRITAGPAGRDGAEVLNFCASNYPGLADDPRLVDAAKRALDERGFGMAPVRFICGTQDLHLELEQALTSPRSPGSATSPRSSGPWSWSTTPTPWASWARPARAPPSTSASPTAWTSAPAPSARRSAGRAAATSPAAPRSSRCSGRRAAPYLFSNSLAPSITAATLQALELVEGSAELRATLFRNAELFRTRMTEEGFDLLPGEHAIVPVMLGDAALAGRMADAMLEQGVFVTAFSYPVVPQGRARIRVQLSAAHSEEDVETAVRAFVAARAAVRG